MSLAPVATTSLVSRRDGIRAASGADSSSSDTASSALALTPSRRCCRARSTARVAESSSVSIRPLTMTAKRLATVVATPSFCSTRRTPKASSSAKRTNRLSICSTIRGASPSVGSSMINSFGFATRARPMASICCSPPESWLPPWARRLERGGKTSYMSSMLQGPPPFAASLRCSSTVSDGQMRRPWGT